MPDRTAAERIVDAAAELFAERGYSATTTRALAQRAEVNEVTIFRLFGSKLGVLGALGERFAVRDAAVQASAEALPDDLHDAVMELAMREVATATAYGTVAMRLAFDAATVPELGGLTAEGRKSNNRAISGFFAEQQREGRVRDDVGPELMADAFFALTSTYVMSRMLLGAASEAAPTNEEAVRHLVELFLCGVVPRG